MAVELQTGSEGVSTSKFDSLELKDGELTIEVQVPAKLSSMKVNLTAEVTCKDKNQKVASSFSRNINLNLDDFHYIDTYLRLTKESEYELMVLGKNGEPLAERKIGINWKYRYDKSEKGGSYQTNKQGIVKMGALSNIDWLQVDATISEANDNISREWRLPRRHAFERPKEI